MESPSGRANGSDARCVWQHVSGIPVLRARVLMAAPAQPGEVARALSHALARDSQGRNWVCVRALQGTVGIRFRIHKWTLLMSAPLAHDLVRHRSAFRRSRIQCSAAFELRCAAEPLPTLSIKGQEARTVWRAGNTRSQQGPGYDRGCTTIHGETSTEDVEEHVVRGTGVGV